MSQAQCLTVRHDHPLPLCHPHHWQCQHTLLVVGINDDKDYPPKKKIAKFLYYLLVLFHNLYNIQTNSVLLIYMIIADKKEKKRQGKKEGVHRPTSTAHLVPHPPCKCLHVDVGAMACICIGGWACGGDGCPHVLGVLVCWENLCVCVCVCAGRWTGMA